MFLQKVTIIKNVWFATVGFLILDSDFKIVVVMVSMICLNVSDIVIITVKDVDFCCIIYNISKSKAINLIENSALDDRECL